MLKLKDLTVKRGNFILKDITLDIEDRKCHVIVGPTGSGKTTLFESILGLIKPERGQILLNSKVDITHLPVERRGISYLPQDLALFPHLNVKGNILYGLKMKGFKIDNTLLNELLESLKIGHLLNRHIDDLSGGESQRIALARAILSGNKILALDEPFSAVHEGMKRELLHLLRRLKERYNLTVIMITHNMDDAYFLGDTLSVLIDGKIHQTDRRDTIYYRPATLEVARFMGIKNLFDVEVVTKESDQLVVRCDSLDSNLIIPSSTVPHHNLSCQRFIAGIRAEDVMFLREDLKSKREENIIKGRVIDIFFKGSYYTVLFKPERRETIIEIDLPDYAFHKLALKKDQTVRISLRKERIFLIGLYFQNIL